MDPVNDPESGLSVTPNMEAVMAGRTLAPPDCVKGARELLEAIFSDQNQEKVETLSPEKY